MHDLLVNGYSAATERAKQFQETQAKNSFRVRFQRSLKACVKRHFAVEDCFGTVWQETLDEVPLFDQEQSDLYVELIEWARPLRR